MSPLPVQDLPSSPRATVDHELRIQLEGAWEILERARTQQDALLKPLASRRWRGHLRRRPELLRQVRELQAPLTEALERARHRLEVGAPDESSLRLLLRQVWAQRTRLEILVLERLEGVLERGTPFAQALERLEERVREPLPLLLHEGEHVLLSIQNPRWFVSLGGVLILGLIARSVYREFHGIELEHASRVGILFGVVECLLPVFPVLIAYLREGCWLLTPRHLVFKPLLGKPRRIPLDSILDSTGITPENHVFTRKVGALRFSWKEPHRSLMKNREERLANIKGLDLLYVLLELHRRPPLFGHVVGPPTYPLTLLPTTRSPATVSPGSDPEPGVLVLRSDRAVFLPERGLDAILQALFERFPSPPPRRLTLTLLLEQLRLLPEADFDRCVDKALRASGGELRPATAYKA